MQCFFVILVVLLLLISCCTFSFTIIFQQKFRFKTLSAQKYDSKQFINISLMKPLGLSLEEVVENEKCGVIVDEVSGNTKDCMKIYKGLFLVSANGLDLKTEDFDSILDVLRSHPEDRPIDLVFIDRKDVYRGPAVLTVLIPDGRTVEVNCLKGQQLLDVLKNSGIEVFGDRKEKINCGGNGQCGTCGVLIEDAKDWIARLLLLLLY